MRQQVQKLSRLQSQLVPTIPLREHSTEKEMVLVSRAVEMYQQIVGEECSLKELWRWLKGLGRQHFKLRIWRVKVKQLLTKHPHVTSGTLADLLREALLLLV